ADWRWLALAFVLFRIFDIAKPWPIRWLDRRLGGGLGIMADDVAAGIVAGAIAWVIVSFAFGG
ncbi:MAG: phosphatidylglycerophosphatase A, partial [Gammaproteobacteria bacterium]